MTLLHNPTRREILGTGIASVTAALASLKKTRSVFAQEKKKIKVVALMGDYWHNPVGLEADIRLIFSKADMRIIFAQASRFLTPEVLKDADLLITERWGGPDSQGWTTEGLVESRNAGDDYMTSEQEEAIAYNIEKRGMGWLACHCSFWNMPPKINAMLGVEPILHQEVQPVLIRDLDQEHPITKGLSGFLVNLDEQFAAIMKSKTHKIIFYTTAVNDKREAIGGWCFDQGNGRVVALLPGHTQWPWRHPTYQEIVWRSAFWAMKRNIPPFEKA